MAKKVAVLAVNPVNGFGLIQYWKRFLKMLYPIRCMQWRKQRKLKQTRVLNWWPDDVIANLIRA